MPPKRGQKRKRQGTTHGHGPNGNVALAPPDRDTWQGWVEMESEPAFFNVMLKEMGVRGVKVQEMVSIDEDGLAMRPVHALIFLFRYRTQDEQDQHTGIPQRHIWFANQVPDYACATIATLNIINNIPGLQMGEELREFRELTKDMDPIERGREIDRFDFVKRIHNSFARENDILTADVHAHGKIAKAKKKATPRRSGRARKAPNRDAYVSEAPEVQQSGFHFIAYMPVEDHVWKLDGLDYHPHDMGSFGLGGNGADGGSGDWMHVVAPVLQNRMQIAQDEGEISFTLLAVVHDSILDDHKELCTNIKTLQAIDKRLDNVYDDWRNLDEVRLEWKAETLVGPSKEYDIFNFDIDQAEVPKDIAEKLGGVDDLTHLIKLRRQSATRQTQIRSSMRETKEAEEQDAERAKHRRHDYGKFVKRWLGTLAGEGTLEGLLE
ncbi:hypothetical protein CERZMDRAFT_52182 [Cercospora zeae-maydis SCOH1-5]|uniref:ubiquitinyl hydrolase 1 n=1 Tax=Cercospora zeae-maydis SCOH1-5 TaxID=717836 RepID=A0A6A6EZP3_9PEZI|nr:hypothetical protein CERZMDRAFT_52182 [Cercospora zeae-maydis SCOH1-5]